MATFDTLITGGMAANACATFKSDVGIHDGKIAALGHDFGDAKQTINASGKYILPGGIEIHAHIAPESATVAMTAGEYYYGQRYLQPSVATPQSCHSPHNIAVRVSQMW